MSASWLSAVKSALRAITANRLRSALALLGITLGVTAIVLVFALGAAAEAEMLHSVRALGANMVMVFPVADSGASAGANLAGRRRLSVADARMLLTRGLGIRAVAPQRRLSVRIQSEGRGVDSSLIGVDPGYFEISSVEVVQGRSMLEADEPPRSVMLSVPLSRKLFGEAESVGRRVQVQQIELEVVGVFDTPAISVTGDASNLALVPLRTVMQRLGSASATDPDGVDLVFAQYDSDVNLDEAKQDVVRLLRERFHVREGDADPFTAETTEAFARQTQRVADALRGVLAAIASISLLVGGIGIMNIMLVAVIERTQEIGVRLAVGARPTDIRRQFLVEAATLSLIGGLVGIVLAIVVSLVGAAMTGWEIRVSWLVAGMVLAFSATIGVLAGYLPAARAANTDPIVALRGI